MAGVRFFLFHHDAAQRPYNSCLPAGRQAGAHQGGGLGDVVGAGGLGKGLRGWEWGGSGWVGDCRGAATIGPQQQQQQQQDRPSALQAGQHPLGASLQSLPSSVRKKKQRLGSGCPP